MLSWIGAPLIERAVLLEMALAELRRLMPQCTSVASAARVLPQQSDADRRLALLTIEGNLELAHRLRFDSALGEAFDKFVQNLNAQIDAANERLTRLRAKVLALQQVAEELVQLEGRARDSMEEREAETGESKVENSRNASRAVQVTHFKFLSF